MKQSRIFEVYEIEKGRRKYLLTKSINPGKSVYGERLFKEAGSEYREWIPDQSKLAAAIACGAGNVGIRKGDTVLYLGASTGTTVSHVSDMVGKEGFIFAVDIAPVVLRELVYLAEDRKNVLPILVDANRPAKLAGKITQVDIIYQDVAQRNQIEIFLKNCDMFLKPGGYALLALKARSIDVTKKPKQIFREAYAELEKNITVIDQKDIGRFEKDHMFFVCKKK